LCSHLGIGLNIAHALAAEGAHIMLNGFADSATVTQITKEISDYGVSVTYNAADLTNPEETRKMVEECVASMTPTKKPR
jgi:3-hydroxybutyrate dehydrogenase